MGFFNRLINNEPIETKLLGVYKYKSVEEPKEFNEVTTAIYLHTYSTTSYKIEITSTPISVFSSFDNASSTTKEFYNLQSLPTEENEGILKFKLANLKIGMYGIVFLHSDSSCGLILPTKEITTFSKRKPL